MHKKRFVINHTIHPDKTAELNPTFLFGLLNFFLFLDFKDIQPEANNKRVFTAFLKNSTLDPVKVSTYLRIGSDNGTFRISAGGVGTLISGEDTNDVVVLTDANGEVDLELTYQGAITANVVGGNAPFKTKLIDYSKSIALIFT